MTESESAREHALDPVSPFFATCLEVVRESAALGPALDLACGRGRHALALARTGHAVVALDRNAESLASLRSAADATQGTLSIVRADLEGATPPPLEPGRFGAILVFRYLHRPLMPWIESLLAPGGVLVYETFTTAQRELGWGPGRDAFLLKPGELPGLFPGLQVETFEEGPTHETRPAETARLLARKRA